LTCYTITLYDSFGKKKLKTDENENLADTMYGSVSAALFEAASTFHHLKVAFKSLYSIWLYLVWIFLALYSTGKFLKT